LKTCNLKGKVVKTIDSIINTINEFVDIRNMDGLGLYR